MGQITRATQAVQGRGDDVSSMMHKIKKALEKSLPNHVHSERFERICMTTLRKNPKLMACSQLSLIGALMETAQLGLEPGIGQMIHLVPYGQEVTVIVGYQGYIELARRAGIQIHPPRVVYEGDEFDVDWGRDNPVVHKPRFQSEDDKDMLFVWVKATGPDGAVWHEVMSRKQIDSVRSKVRGRGGPWQDHLVEMARKTVVRRVAKYLWKSSEIAHAESLDGVAITGFSPEGFAELVEDTTATVVERPEVVAEKPDRTARGQMAYARGREIDAELLIEAATERMVSEGKPPPKRRRKVKKESEQQAKPIGDPEREAIMALEREEAREDQLNL